MFNLPGSDSQVHTEGVEGRIMEERFDPRYCPQCYQYVGETDGRPNACRACFGESRREPETSFEAAFIILTDIDGATSGESVESTRDTVHEGAEIRIVADGDAPQNG